VGKWKGSDHVIILDNGKIFGLFFFSFFTKSAEFCFFRVHNRLKQRTKGTPSLHSSRYSRFLQHTLIIRITQDHTIFTSRPTFTWMSFAAVAPFADFDIRRNGSSRDAELPMSTMLFDGALLGRLDRRFIRVVNILLH
jgi:hypothetical protein